MYCYINYGFCIIVEYMQINKFKPQCQIVNPNKLFVCFSRWRLEWNDFIKLSGCNPFLSHTLPNVLQETLNFSSFNSRIIRTRSRTDIMLSHRLVNYLDYDKLWSFQNTQKIPKQFIMYSFKYRWKYFLM